MYLDLASCLVYLSHMFPEPTYERTNNAACWWFELLCDSMLLVLPRLVGGGWWWCHLVVMWWWQRGEGDGRAGSVKDDEDGHLIYKSGDVLQARCTQLCSVTFSLKQTPNLFQQTNTPFSQVEHGDLFYSKRSSGLNFWGVLSISLINV